MLHQTFTTRPGAARFRGLSPQEHESVVEMNRRYGLWLRDLERHEALPNRAVVKGHGHWSVAAGRLKLRAA